MARLRLQSNQVHSGGNDARYALLGVSEVVLQLGGEAGIRAGQWEQLVVMVAVWVLESSCCGSRGWRALKWLYFGGWSRFSKEEVMRRARNLQRALRVEGRKRLVRRQFDGWVHEDDLRMR